MMHLEFITMMFSVEKMLSFNLVVPFSKSVSISKTCVTSSVTEYMLLTDACRELSVLLSHILL